MEKAPRSSVTENSTAQKNEPGLELTAKEQQTEVWLETDKRMRNLVSEHYIVPGMNAVGKKLDSLRDIKDVAAKKALLLEYREGAKQQKVARLQEKLSGINPNTMRYRRLSKKLGKTAIKLGDIRTGIRIRSESIKDRNTKRERANLGREIDAYIRRELLLVAKKVAHEKQERRKLKQQLDQEKNVGRKEELRAEYANHTALPIGKFRENLINQVLRNADKVRADRRKKEISITASADESEKSPVDIEVVTENELRETVNEIQSAANQKFIDRMGELGGVLEQYEELLEVDGYIEKQIAEALTDEDKARWDRITKENDQKMSNLKELMDIEYAPIEEAMIEDEAYAQNTAIDRLNEVGREMKSPLTRDFLQSIGVEMDNDTFDTFSKHFSDTLYDRIIDSTIKNLNQNQLQQLSTLKNADDSRLWGWLRANVPSLGQIVIEETEILLGDTAESSDHL